METLESWTLPSPPCNVAVGFVDLQTPTHKTVKQIHPKKPKDKYPKKHQQSKYQNRKY